MYWNWVKGRKDNWDISQEDDDVFGNLQSKFKSKSLLRYVRGVWLSTERERERREREKEKERPLDLKIDSFMILRKEDYEFKLKEKKFSE